MDVNYNAGYSDGDNYDDDDGDDDDHDYDVNGRCAILI